MKPQNKNLIIARILLFLIIGLFNTFLIRPEDIGTWKNYVGYGAILIAVIDLTIFGIKHFKSNDKE